MKILLIYPYCLEDRIHTEDISVVPQGVYYIAAMLKTENYDVEILNWYNINKTPGKIDEILKTKKPDIIGFSILHANRWGGIEIAGIARRINPHVKIVFGGIGATFLWEHFLTHFKEVDYIVIGEGENSFLELVTCLDKKKYHDIPGIKGIAYRKNGMPIRTGNAENIKDLDQLPNPAGYFSYQHLSLTRGCPGRCTFCGSPRFWKRRVRSHTVDYFIEELELLIQKGIGFFYFSDDTFTMSKKRTIEICQKIIKKKLGIVWVAISKVSFVDEDILYWMRMAGCIQISYGVESGSKRIRESLNKDITYEEITNAFSLTVRYGILARAYFIYGCPGETWETIGETVRLIQKINPLSAIFYILDIFPGTDIYEEYMKKNNDSDTVWLNRIEDIMYFEIDPVLKSDTILKFGNHLRASFFGNLENAVTKIDLIDKKELFPMHSDFLSRLAMTFDQGDYAGIESIKTSDTIAENLYKQALTYFPDSRAFLGLGIIKQKRKEYGESVNVLKEGISCFPNNPNLSMCLGVSYMNLGQYAKALDCFLLYQESEQSLKLIIECSKAMGNDAMADKYIERLKLNFTGQGLDPTSNNF